MSWGLVAGLSNMMGLSTALSALGSILQYKGQKDTNQTNVDIANRQMDFQASQTGTAYQRAVSDMMKAGLNPMLAYSQGGAQSGAGASTRVENALGAGVSGAKQGAEMAQVAQGILTSQAQADAYAAQAGQLRSQTVGNALETDAKAAAIEKDKSTSWNLKASANNAFAANAGVWADSMSKERQLDQMIKHGGFSARAAKEVSEAQSADYHQQEKEYGLARERAYSRYYDTPVGKSEPYISLGSGLISSASQARRAFGPRPR